MTLSPQKQKQKTQEALVAWIVEETEKARRLLRLGRSTLGGPLDAWKWLTLYLDQIPTARMLLANVSA